MEKEVNNFKEIYSYDNSDYYLNKIKVEVIKKFVEEALIEYSSITKLRKANKVADIVWQKFSHMGYINEMVAQQQFVDLTIAAALLYNLFYTPSDITSILKHRIKLIDAKKKSGIDDRLVSLIYETIESQLGENHPVQKLKPTPNSPASILADAVWQINDFKPLV